MAGKLHRARLFPHSGDLEHRYTYVQLRLEAYNAPNHANFGVNIGSAYISSCSSGSCGTGLITGGYALLINNTYGDNRNVQLGAKIIF